MCTETEKVPEPGIFHISGGIGTSIEKIWYQKSLRTSLGENLAPKYVPEPVSEKFGTEKSPGRGQIFGSCHTLS